VIIFKGSEHYSCNSYNSWLHVRKRITEGRNQFFSIRPRTDYATSYSTCNVLYEYF